MKRPAELKDLLRFELTLCPPERRATESEWKGTLNEGPLTRCAELVLKPLRDEIDRERIQRPTWEELAGFVGRSPTWVSKLLNHGIFELQDRRKSIQAWSQLRQMFYALLLGVNAAKKLAKQGPEEKYEWQVVKRTADYFFGEEDDGAFFRAEVMYSPAPYRPNEGTYELLAAANSTLALEQGEDEGAIHIVSGGSRFAQAEVPLLASATVALAGIGRTCCFCYPDPQVVKTEAWHSILAFRNVVTKALEQPCDNPAVFEYLFAMRRAWQPDEQRDGSLEKEGQTARPTINVTDELRKRIRRNLKCIQIDLVVTEEHVKQARLWPGQFANPAFRYVRIPRVGEKKPRLFVSREPGERVSSRGFVQCDYVAEPFSFRGSTMEEACFSEWLSWVESRSEAINLSNIDSATATAPSSPTAKPRGGGRQAPTKKRRR